MSVPNRHIVERLVPAPKPVLRAIPTFSEPKQIQSAKNSNTINAQDDGI